MTSDGPAAGLESAAGARSICGVYVPRSIPSSAPMADRGWKRRFRATYIVAARCGMIWAGGLF
jgi:hypothetical protein